MQSKDEYRRGGKERGGRKRRRGEEDRGMAIVGKEVGCRQEQHQQRGWCRGG